ncbi:hypothetical protein ILUMI_17881 [Ignelater luminosus]|uniref:Uncharacterized protein n=1 Tax=Ignelater luminosus TaxID=2038154 RepID=A0A8K0CQ82_IGNLU|nr:hypothetical protein ILUMI_17881 [Ignelater luminosus]
MPIDPTIFGEENFLASDYLLSIENNTTNLINQDQAAPTPKANICHEQTPNNILTPRKTILSPLPFPTVVKARKRVNAKHSATSTAIPLKADLENCRKTRKRDASPTKKRQSRNIKNQKPLQNFLVQMKKFRLPRGRRKFRNLLRQAQAQATNGIWKIFVTTATMISPTKEHEACFICNESGNNEAWYGCRGCGQWAHKDYSGADAPAIISM